MNLLRHLAAPAVLACLAHAAHAQANRTIQVTEVAQTLEGIEKHPSAVVEDLGDIRPLSSKGLLRRMRFTAALRGEYVSNAASVGNHANGDFLLLPSLDAAFEQPLSRGLSLSFNARTESFIYSRFDRFSFWGFSGAAFLNYQPTADWPKVYAGIEPYWYSSVRTGNPLARALPISAGIEKEWAFNRDQTIVFAGYTFSHFVSAPAGDDRDSHRGTVGITQQLAPSLYGQLYYAYQFTDYANLPRRDHRHLAGLSLTYQFSENWFGNATTYFVDSDSSVPFASYQTFGIGLGAAFRF